MSKSRVSESIGRRGAWFAIGPRGTRSTVGLPGSGLSYTEQQHRGVGGEVGWILLLLVVVSVLAFVFAA